MMLLCTGAIIVLLDSHGTAKRHHLHSGVPLPLLDESNISRRDSGLLDKEGRTFRGPLYWNALYTHELPTRVWSRVFSGCLWDTSPRLASHVVCRAQELSLSALTLRARHRIIKAIEDASHDRSLPRMDLMR